MEKKENVGKVTLMRSKGRDIARGKKEGNMILAKAKCGRRDTIHGIGSYRTASQDPIPSFAKFERLFILKSPV